LVEGGSWQEARIARLAFVFRAQGSKRRRLGQHELVGARVLAKVVSATQIQKTEMVCEAGAGTGVLTKRLCERAAAVVSYEVDKELFRQTNRSLSAYHNLELVNSDLFAQESVQFDVFVSNLPYSRSRDAIEWLATQRFKRAIIMVQQEFAAKLLAKPGTRNYRAIAVLAQYCFNIERLFKVSRESFEPVPAVESEVIRLVPVRPVTRQTIKKLNIIFSQRNKRFSSVASKFSLDYFRSESRRLRELDPETIMHAANSITLSK
jgi:16S rRNA (adenine1518-N6/adenine1519-N6)-dimethyltransferase